VIFIAAGVVITNAFLYLISGQMFMQLYVIICSNAQTRFLLYVRRIFCQL
jgi:hypothetical protein